MTSLQAHGFLSNLPSGSRRNARLHICSSQSRATSRPRATHLLLRQNTLPQAVPPPSSRKDLQQLSFPRLHAQEEVRLSTRAARMRVPLDSACEVPCPTRGNEEAQRPLRLHMPLPMLLLRPRLLQLRRRVDLEAKVACRRARVRLAAARARLRPLPRAHLSTTAMGA